MIKKRMLVAFISILLFSVVTSTQFVNLASSLYLGLVTIKADGTVYPTDAPIQRVKEVYILTDDIESIRVERSNIMLDGQGHNVPAEEFSSLPRGTSSNTNGILLDNVENVTVTNLTVKGVFCGIFLDRTTNCTVMNNTITETTAPIPQLQATAGIYVWGANSNTITANKITNNHIGIYMGYFSEQNVVTQNNITESVSSGLMFWAASDNFFYNNSFIDNAMHVAANEDRVNFWDNGLVGNFWSDYNGTDANADRIGDIPYIIDANNIDHYPLMKPVTIPDSSDGTDSSESPNEPEPFPTALVVAASIATVVVVGVGSLVYFKKRKH